MRSCSTIMMKAPFLLAAALASIIIPLTCTTLHPPQLTVTNIYVHLYSVYASDGLCRYMYIYVGQSTCKLTRPPVTLSIGVCACINAHDSDAKSRHASAFRSCSMCRSLSHDCECLPAAPLAPGQCCVGRPRTGRPQSGSCPLRQQRQSPPLAGGLCACLGTRGSWGVGLAPWCCALPPWSSMPPAPTQAQHIIGCFHLVCRNLHLALMPSIATGSGPAKPRLCRVGESTVPTQLRSRMKVQQVCWS